MSTDDKPPMPPQPKTAQLEKVPDWAIALIGKVGEVQRSTTTIEQQVDVLIQDGKASNQRITALEVRFDDMDKRRENSSLRARQSNEVDQRHEAAIAALHEKTDAQTKDIAELKATQEEQLSILKRLEAPLSKLISNPYFKYCVIALITYIFSHLNIPLPKVTP